MGDIIRPGRVPMKLSAEVIGTAPVERVDVLHGTDGRADGAAVSAPSDLGRRVRVLWQGAEYRGRGRETIWQGKLTLAGNRITRFAAGELPQPRAEDDRDRAGHGAGLDLGHHRQSRRRRSLAR